MMEKERRRKKQPNSRVALGSSSRELQQTDSMKLLSSQLNGANCSRTQLGDISHHNRNCFCFYAAAAVACCRRRRRRVKYGSLERLTGRRQ